jgi:preprotein translocase subunit SecG
MMMMMMIMIIIIIIIYLTVNVLLPGGSGYNACTVHKYETRI